MDSFQKSFVSAPSQQHPFSQNLSQISSSTLQPLYVSLAPPATYKLWDVFFDIETARRQVYTSIIDRHESYKTYKSESKYTILKCRGDEPCTFRVRIDVEARTGLAKVTINEPHTCSPAVHENFKEANSQWYLERHMWAQLEENRAISPTVLRSLEKVAHQHPGVPYIQMWRMKKTVLEKLDGKEEEQFAKFPAYCRRFEAADPDNYHALKLEPETEKFQAVFFAPAACRETQRLLRPIFFTDGTHTRSKYNLTLLTCSGIDANGKITPIGWALVPVENKYWWTWFLEQLNCAHSLDKRDKVVWMNDRQKG